MTTNTNTENVGLLDIIVKYLRNWKLFLIAFLFATVMAVLYVLFYFETYAGETRMQIVSEKGMGPGNIGDLGIMKTLGMGGSLGSINMDDETQIVKSHVVLQEVVLTLGLQVSYSYPAFFAYELYKDNPLIIKADSATFTQLEKEVLIEVDIAPGKITGTVKTNDRPKESFTFTSLPAVIKTQQGEFTLDYSGKIAAPESFSMNIEIIPISWKIEKLAKQISIDNYSKNSNIIILEYEDNERQRLKDVLNTLVAKYNQYTTKIKNNDGGKSIRFLDERLATIYTDLKNAELTIEDYKSKNHYTDIESDVKLYTTQLVELQRNIIEHETGLYSIELLEDFIKKDENKYELIPSLLNSKIGDIGTVLTEYNELLIKRATVLEQTHESSAVILTYNKQLESLRKSVALTIKNSKEGMTLSLKNLKNKESKLLSKIGNVPSYEKEYTDSRRQQEILQNIYLYLLQKREEIALSIGEEKDKGQSLYPTYIKKQRVAPRKLYAAIGIMAFTLIFPVCFLFCKEQYIAIRRRIKTPIEQD